MKILARVTALALAALLYGAYWLLTPSVIKLRWLLSKVPKWLPLIGGVWLLWDQLLCAAWATHVVEASTTHDGGCSFVSGLLLGGTAGAILVAYVNRNETPIAYTRGYNDAAHGDKRRYPETCRQ